MGLDAAYGIGSLKSGVCTSSTRPTSAYDGQMIYETDTNLVRIWNGSAWKTVGLSDYTSGAVLQVVNESQSAQESTNSASFVNTGLSATITPSSTSSKILITVTQNGVTKIQNTSIDINLVRGSTVISGFGRRIGYTATTGWGYSGTAGVTYLDSPATTSATTYKTMFASTDGIASAYVQAFGAISYITLQEIAG